MLAQIPPRVASFINVSVRASRRGGIEKLHRRIESSRARAAARRSPGRRQNGSDDHARADVATERTGRSHAASPIAPRPGHRAERGQARRSEEPGREAAARASELRCATRGGSLAERGRRAARGTRPLCQAAALARGVRQRARRWPCLSAASSSPSGSKEHATPARRQNRADSTAPRVFSRRYQRAPAVDAEGMAARVCRARP